MFRSLAEALPGQRVRTASGPSEAPRPAREERRRHPRYAPFNPRVYVGWWRGEAFITERGVLKNFSEGGAAVALKADPGPAESVWLCIVGPGRVNWTPARVVGREVSVVRMQFAEPLPYELFALLT